MTVTSTIRRSDALGSGVTKTYSYGFRILDDDDLIVSVQDTAGVITALTKTTDYTVTGVGLYAGGTIVLVNAGQNWLDADGDLKSSYKLTIRRRLPLTQQTDLRNSGDFFPEDHETQFDRGIMIALQQQDELDRSIKFPETDSPTLSASLPAASLRANKYVAFDAQGNVIASSGPISGVPVSAFMQTVLDDASVNDAVATLGLSDTNNTSLGDFLIGGRLTLSGAAAFTLHGFNEKRPVYGELDFSIVADDATDNGTALTNFFNAARLNPGRRFVLPAGIIRTSVALPNIDVKGTWIEAAGVQTPHDVGTETVLTSIKYTGAAGATVLTIAPPTGASAQRLDAVIFRGIGIDCNQLAARGLVINSVQNSTIQVYAREGTTSSVEIGVVGTLGEATDTQFCTFDITTENLLTTGAGIRIKGDAAGNTSFNVFRHINIQHLNGPAIVEENADNNIWLNVRTYRGAGGTGDGIIWQGGATAATCARSETFIKLSCNSNLLVKGTPAYASPAQNIRIYELDFENNPTVAPTIETGATCYWRDNKHTFVGFAADDASGTSYGAGPTDIGFGNEDYDPLAKFATPTFTAPMPDKYKFKLKVTHTAGVTVGDRWIFKLVTTTKTYSFQYTVHTANFNTIVYTQDANMNSGNTAKWTIERAGGTGNFPLVADAAYNTFSGRALGAV